MLGGVPLLLAAAGAWYFSAYVLPAPSMGMAGGVPILSMAGTFLAPTVPGVSSFLLVWVVGMMAMMFPAMIPVVTMYSKLMVKGERRPRLARVVGRPLFLAGYLGAYAALGAALFGVVFGAFQAGRALPGLPDYSAYALAGVLLLTGVWQVTPLKERALTQCVSPMGFFMTKARSGLCGAFRMGVLHGWYCVGCCWLYMLVMLAVASMSVLSMVLLSGLIIVEKVFLGGARWFRWLSAGIFVVLSAAVALYPALLASV